MPRTANRVVIVTGAANGIGLATAKAFGQAGYRVVAWDVVEDYDELLAQVDNLTYSRVDVSDQALVEQATAPAIGKLERVDVLINNAGILRDGQLVKAKRRAVTGKMSEADFDAVIGVNLKGVFNCTQAVAPHMIARGYGRIVNASSVVGLYGNFGQTNYVAAKAGVIGMTKVWARELGKHGITVNAVAPGFVATDMVQQMPQEILDRMVARTPVGRIGSVEDIARAYVWLADEASGFISGAVLSVDGGMVVGT